MSKNKKDEIEYALDGRNYYLDLKAMCRFISNSTDPNGSERIEREIINNYEIEDSDEGLTLTAKSVREITGPSEGGLENIRYDLLKLFVIQLITFCDRTELPYDKKGETIEIPVVYIEHLPLGTRIAFNTLLQEGILKIK